MADLSERLLLAHVDSEKSASGTVASWVDSAVGARLSLAVTMASVTMRVGGMFRSAEDQQLWLDHPQWKHGRRHLVRLCCTPAHMSDLHWHWFEGDPKLERTKPMSSDYSSLDLTDRGTLFVDVFVPAMKIMHYQYEGRLQ